MITDLARSRRPVELQLRLSPRPILIALSAIIGLLFLFSAIGQIGRFYFDRPTMFGFVRLFYLDEEHNVPVWYQSLALLGCAVLLALTAAVERRRRTGLWGHWAGLAAIFTGLSVDEVAGIHEATIGPLQVAMGGQPGGIWAVTWVIPALAFLAIVGILYARFLLALPMRERAALLVAAACYVGGAVVAEMVTGSELASAALTKQTAGYAALVHLEEGLEMLGVLLLLRVLLKRLSNAVSLTVTVDDRATPRLSQSRPQETQSRSNAA
jgi:hypothetical protein